MFPNILKTKSKHSDNLFCFVRVVNNFVFPSTCSKDQSVDVLFVFLANTLVYCLRYRQEGNETNLVVQFSLSRAACKMTKY